MEEKVIKITREVLPCDSEVLCEVCEELGASERAVYRLSDGGLVCKSCNAEIPKEIGGGYTILTAEELQTQKEAFELYISKFRNMLTTP